MKLKCPLCDMELEAEGSVDMGMALEGHLLERHKLASGSKYLSEEELERVVTTNTGIRPEDLDDEAKRHIKYVTKSQGERGPTTKEEDAVRKFSGTNEADLTDESKRHIQYVTQYRKGSDTESDAECYVRTHSEAMCRVQTDEEKKLLATVKELREQRRKTCKMVPCFPCPMCGFLVEGDTEDELSDDLKAHFIEAHDI